LDIYDVKTGKRLHAIPLKAKQPVGGGDSSCRIPFAISDNVVVVHGATEAATVYDLGTGKELGDLPRSDRMGMMALSPDGRWLLASDRKDAVHTWDVKALKYDRLLYEHISRVNCVAISPDGRWCAFGTDRGIKVFDRTTGGQKAEGRAGLGHATCLVFSPDAKRIIASVEPRIRTPDRVDSHLRFWDWRTEEPPTAVMYSITPDEWSKRWQNLGWCRPYVMTSDGNRFLSVGGGQGLLLLDLKNPNPPPEKKPEAKDKKQ
jgi:WD40 repeat protein